MPQESHHRSSLMCPQDIRSCRIPSEPLPRGRPSPSDLFQMCEYDRKGPISKPLWTEAPASALWSFPWTDAWVMPSHVTAAASSSQRPLSFWQEGHQDPVSPERGKFWLFEISLYTRIDTDSRGVARRGHFREELSLTPMKFLPSPLK